MKEGEYQPRANNNLSAIITDTFREYYVISITMFDIISCNAL